MEDLPLGQEVHLITRGREQFVVGFHYDFSQPSEAFCDVMMELAMLRAADAVRTSADLTSAELISPALARGLPGYTLPLCCAGPA